MGAKRENLIQEKKRHWGAMGLADGRLQGIKGRGPIMP